MAELKIRDAKLVQYLNEAYGKEKELETALAAHIGMTTRAPYKKRLQQHLGETKRHARELERAVKRLGGTAQVVRIEGLDPIAKGAGAALELGSRAMAAAKGPLHAIRGTGEQEKMLKNAKSEYADEHEEIATYTAIETLAQELGDPDTVKLARAIRREEQGMARFLERLIPTLTKAVTQAEVPAAERANGRRGARRRSSSARSRERESGLDTLRLESENARRGEIHALGLESSVALGLESGVARDRRIEPLARARKRVGRSARADHGRGGTGEARATARRAAARSG